MWLRLGVDYGLMDVSWLPGGHRKIGQEWSGLVSEVVNYG